MCLSLLLLHIQNNYTHVSFKTLLSITNTLHKLKSMAIDNKANCFWMVKGCIKTKTYNDKTIKIIKLIIPFWHLYLNLKQSILKQGKQNTRKSRFWCTKIRISAKSSYSIFRLSLMKQILWTEEMTFLSYICHIK